MLYKPVVSLIMIFAAASSAAASATPLRRGGNGGYPPSSTPAIPLSKCAESNAQCCGDIKSSNDPVTSTLLGLLGLVVGPNVNVGLSCTNLLLSGQQCNSNAVCCTNVNQNGLVNLGCSPLNLNL